MKNLIVLLLLITSISKSQMNLDRVKSFHYNKEGDYYYEVKTIMPDYGLNFTYNLSSKENIDISIFADSLSPKSMSVRIYAFLPKSINVRKTSLYLIFDDEAKYKYDIKRADDDNYVEFGVNEGNFLPLLNKKVIYIEFEKITSFRNYDESYFMEFFRLISNRK